MTDGWRRTQNAAVRRPGGPGPEGEPIRQARAMFEHLHGAVQAHAREERREGPAAPGVCFMRLAHGDAAFRPRAAGR